MKRTYVDSDVLFAAARGTYAISNSALELLSDPNRQFVSGIFSMMEVLPVPRYNGSADEVNFYEEFFRGCCEIIEASEDLCREAYDEAMRHGMGAVDAIHVVSARRCHVDELVTAESENKAIHRTDLVSVTRII